MGKVVTSTFLRLQFGSLHFLSRHLVIRHFNVAPSDFFLRKPIRPTFSVCQQTRISPTLPLRIARVYVYSGSTIFVQVRNVERKNAKIHNVDLKI
jgi:hypothetical protein